MTISANPSTNQEARWDARASYFNARQLAYEQVIPKAIVNYLCDKFPFVQNIMDVGGGSGRYALLFGEKVNSVYMTDISKKMLEYARENAENKGLTNINFCQLDWDNQVDNQPIKTKYDLVFSSMCPATRTLDGIHKMMTYAEGYCAVNQFILAEDSLSLFIYEALKTFYENKGENFEKSYDPHNDRAMVQRTFNELWEKGYHPELAYFSEESHVEINVEEAKEYYTAFKEYKDEEKKVVEQAIEKYADNNLCKIFKKDVSALIVWHVEKE